MFNTILYPTDGSRGAAVALDHAQDLAETYGATVHVLYVVDAEHTESGMFVRRTADGDWHTGMVPRDHESAGKGHMSTHPEESPEGVERKGQELTNEVSSWLSEQDIESVTAVKHGEPYQVITDYAEDNDIDLITMGTHGRRGIQHQLIGSVTEKVVRISEVPVLTVRHTEDDAS